MMFEVLSDFRFTKLTIFPENDDGEKHDFDETYPDSDEPPFSNDETKNERIRNQP
jgi:hypothetical protein